MEEEGDAPALLPARRERDCVLTLASADGAAPLAAVAKRINELYKPGGAAACTRESARLGGGTLLATSTSSAHA